MFRRLWDWIHSLRHTVPPPCFEENPNNHALQQATGANQETTPYTASSFLRTILGINSSVHKFRLGEIKGTKQKRK